jgi:hypothetical protein
MQIADGGETTMGAAENLGTYAQGWTNGDSEAILKAVSDDYTIDDPNSGVIPNSAHRVAWRQSTQTSKVGFFARFRGVLFRVPSGVVARYPYNRAGSVRMRGDWNEQRLKK